MRIRDLPVIYDMLRLPWHVLERRLRRRIFNSESGKKSIDTEKVQLADQSILPPNFTKILSLDKDKWHVLLDYYLSDELNYLGSGWLSIRNDQGGSDPRRELALDEPDWNRIHRTGYLIPNGKSSNVISKVFSESGQDVKDCWEIGRMHHLVHLGWAANLFPNRRGDILTKVQQHLISFIHQCPPGWGVHWSSPMEASIRLTNILICIDMLPEIRNEFIKQSCIDHYEFILNNLEQKEGYGTNHYLSNLMGLIVGGFYLKSSETYPVTQWAVREFEKELEKQFFNDGVNFEYSTYYHRLSTEMALISFHVARLLNMDFSDTALQKLSKAVKLVRLLLKPNGHLPIFGDNDSGRILEFDPVLDKNMEPDREDCTYLVSTWDCTNADQLFYKKIIQDLPKTVELKSDLIGVQDEFELNYHQAWSINFPEIRTSEISRTDYPDGGIYLFKSHDFYLAVNLMSNPNGHRFHGHMHNDKGSFELCVHDQNLISDPGVYCYTADVTTRNRYRSTKAHPVPFAGVEQNSFMENQFGLFHMKLEVKCKTLQLWERGMTARIVYNGIMHIRKFEIFNNKLVIEDWCNKDFTVSRLPDLAIAPGYGKTL